MSLAFMGGIGIQELVVILFLLSFVFIIPLIALIDAIRSDFKGQNDKIMWVIIIILFPIIGCFLYFSIGRRQKAV